ncbi:hypothetical protein RHGRI_004898 [Rhododendron griersonianum]|uniref:Uncharacterized protein n=1 Tax=Rhododendron griersonianum TaxID=479676 RepID=A0AAV6LAN9_9ERIC|nr:hypothetical protein RHGRI_004898 [Rhododendron griersonianum]
MRWKEFFLMKIQKFHNHWWIGICLQSMMNTLKRDLIVKGHQYTGSTTIVMTIGACPKKKAELNLMEEESEPIYHEESGGVFEEEVCFPNFNAECLLIQLVMVTKEDIGDVWDGEGCGKNDVMTITECFKPPICDENLEDNVKLEKLKPHKSLLITKEFVSAK